MPRFLCFRIKNNYKQLNELFLFSIFEYLYNSVLMKFIYMLEFFGSISWWLWIIIVIVIVAIRDIIQRKHTISHNYPVVGHIRYLFESIGPEIRQYFVANNRPA